MAIGITYKSSVYQTTNSQSTFTGSPTWTPQANSLLVCFVCTAYSSSPTDPSGVTGHGVSYSQLTLGTSTLSTTHKLSAWVAKAGASPTSAAPVATVTSTNGTGDLLIEFEITGHDNSGTALQAIVASSATNNGTSTTPTVTLASPASPANRAMTFVVQLSNAAPTTSGSWTLSANASGNFNTPATGAAALFDTASFNTAGAATTANVAWRMVGIEIKADPVTQPGAGSGSLTGTTPTLGVTDHRTASPDAVTATLTGAVPTLSVSRTASPGVGTVSLAGKSTSLPPNLYYVIYPSAGSDPSAAQIKAGKDATNSAATASGFEVSPTGSTTYTFAAPATGLSAGTSYKVAFVWSDGTNDSNVAVSDSFSTDAASDTVAPSAGSITLTGQAPTGITGTVIGVPAGGISVVGQTPAAVVEMLNLPSAGTVTISGQEPVVVAGSVVEPASGAATITGPPPTRAMTMPVGAGEVSISGQAPTVSEGAVVTDTAISPLSGSITFAGRGVLLGSGNFTAPDTGTITISGEGPSLFLEEFRQPGVGSVSVTGQQPALLVDAVVQPEAGAMLISGEAPEIGIGSRVDTSAGSIVISGQAPSLFVETIRTPNAGSVVIAGLAPQTVVGTSVSPGAGTISASGLAPAVVESSVVSPGVGSVAIQGETPGLGIGIQPAAGSVSISGPAPAIALESPSFIPAAGSISLDGLVPTVSVSVTNTVVGGGGSRPPERLRLRKTNDDEEIGLLLVAFLHAIDMQ